MHSLSRNTVSLCAPDPPPDSGPANPISPSWVQWMDAAKIITRHERINIVNKHRHLHVFRFSTRRNLVVVPGCPWQPGGLAYNCCSDTWSIWRISRNSAWLRLAFRIWSTHFFVSSHSTVGSCCCWADTQCHLLLGIFTGTLTSTERSCPFDGRFGCPQPAVKRTALQDSHSQYAPSVVACPPGVVEEHDCPPFAAHHAWARQYPWSFPRHTAAIPCGRRAASTSLRSRLCSQSQQSPLFRMRTAHRAAKSPTVTHHTSEVDHGSSAKRIRVWTVRGNRRKLQRNTPDSRITRARPPAPAWVGSRQPDWRIGGIRYASIHPFAILVNLHPQPVCGLSQASFTT